MKGIIIPTIIGCCVGTVIALIINSLSNSVYCEYDVYNGGVKINTVIYKSHASCDSYGARGTYYKAIREIKYKEE